MFGVHSREVHFCRSDTNPSSIINHALKGTFKPTAQKVASVCNTKGQDYVAVFVTPGTRVSLYKIIRWDRMESSYPSFQMCAHVYLYPPPRRSDSMCSDTSKGLVGRNSFGKGHCHSVLQCIVEILLYFQCHVQLKCSCGGYGMFTLYFSHKVVCGIIYSHTG